MTPHFILMHQIILMQTVELLEYNEMNYQFGFK